MDIPNASTSKHIIRESGQDDTYIPIAVIPIICKYTPKQDSSSGSEQGDKTLPDGI